MIKILQEIKMGIYSDVHGNDIDLFEIGEDEISGKTIAIYRTINRNSYTMNGITMTMEYNTFEKSYKYKGKQK